MRHPGRYCTLIVLILSLLPTLTFASPSGVYIDQDSPSGREYALPMEQARDAASGSLNRQSANSQSGSVRHAPLFGVGINDRRTARQVLNHNGRSNGMGIQVSNERPPFHQRSSLDSAAGTPNGENGLFTVFAIACASLICAGGLGWGMRYLVNRRN